MILLNIKQTFSGKLPNKYRPKQAVLIATKNNIFYVRPLKNNQ